MQKQPIKIDATDMTLQQVLKAAEAAYISQTLAATGLNKRQASQIAGVSYNRFLEKCARLDLKVTCEAA
ncbi:MAG: hypothetical protein Q4G26_06180 [Paracoccus sp. (in: a-proteobacteria)]|nr:hypothetical protein [Paracoccus sp. (in: a-proteobacteria)]